MCVRALGVEGADPKARQSFSVCVELLRDGLRGTEPRAHPNMSNCHEHVPAHARLRASPDGPART